MHFEVVAKVKSWSCWEFQAQFLIREYSHFEKMWMFIGKSGQVRKINMQEMHREAISHEINLKEFSA